MRLRADSKKEPLIIRHHELVESLMTPKPVLYAGIPVMHNGEILMEIEAGAAAKVNMDLIELGGHKPKEDQKLNFGHGPALVIQVMAQDGTVQIAQLNNGVEIQQPTPSFWRSTMSKLNPLGPVAGAFYQDNSEIAVIMGPVGSAKTTAFLQRLVRHAYEQRPYDGIRRTRFAIARNTGPQLKDTTIASG